MGLNQSLPFFSMENERVERLSQRVEQWSPLSHSEMILGSNADWSLSVWRLHVPPVWRYLWIRQLPSSMYIQRYTWALVRLIGRKIGHWCDCFSISSSQTGSLSRVYPISCPVAAWIGFSTPMIVTLIFVCKMLMLIIKLFQFYFIFKRD